MKISGVRVDGYGALSGLEIREFSTRLSVLIGPNEAGKSTLLDFVRGVLFGFPDRRSKLPYRAPVNGGRHGGALFFTDDAGRRLVLERHSDARRPVLTLDDGTVLSEEELTIQLGGADDALFRTVYAFGLSELASLDGLERDEVREAVFSAGVLGAGRSASRAMRILEQRRLEIVRPRQGEAIANSLRRRLDDLEDQLRTARASALHYPEARARVERLEAHVREARVNFERQRQRAAELDLLLRCWPSWRRRSDAEETLSELPAPSDEPKRLLALAPSIERLSADRSGHDERVRRVTELSGQLAGIERSIATRRGTIPSSIEPASARQLGDEEEDRARELDLAIEKSRGELASTESELERANVALAAARRDLAGRSNSPLPKEAHVLGERERALERMRRLIVDRDSKESAMLSHSRELAVLSSRREDKPGHIALVSVLSLFGVVGAVYASMRHQPAFAIVCALGVVALAVVAVLAVSRRSENAPSAADEALLLQQRDVATLNDEVTALARSCALNERPRLADVEAELEELRAERVSRQEIDALLARVHDCEERHADAAKRAEASKLALRSLSASVEEFLSSLEMTLAEQPSRVFPIIAAVRDIQSAEAGKERVERDLAAQKATIASFVAETGRIFNEAFPERGRQADDARRSEESSSMLDVVADALLAAQKSQVVRDELEQRVHDESAVLREQFGTGESAARLLGELESGEILAWEREQNELGAAISEEELHYEQLVRELADEERSTAELLSSDDVATLELEYEAVKLELEEALDRWLTLGFAKSLLEQTLARYERERQPAVIAKASELFSLATNGRYDKVVAREDPDGSRRHGLEVITPSGIRVDSGDLSRGTAEQLYICLRLAFATTFAERGVSLPLVLDDVLVNFDPSRSAAIARVIAEVAREHQVLAFTCHPHVVEHFRAFDPDCALIELPGRS